MRHLLEDPLVRGSPLVPEVLEAPVVWKEVERKYCSYLASRNTRWSFILPQRHDSDLRVRRLPIGSVHIIVALRVWMAELQTKTVHFQNETGKKIEQEFNAPASFSRLFVRMGFHLSPVLSVQIARIFYFILMALMHLLLFKALRALHTENVIHSQWWWWWWTVKWGCRSETILTSTKHSLMFKQGTEGAKSLAKGHNNRDWDGAGFELPTSRLLDDPMKAFICTFDFLTDAWFWGW